MQICIINKQKTTKKFSGQKNYSFSSEVSFVQLSVMVSI